MTTTTSISIKVNPRVARSLGLWRPSALKRGSFCPFSALFFKSESLFAWYSLAGGHFYPRPGIVCNGYAKGARRREEIPRAMESSRAVEESPGK